MTDLVKWLREEISFAYHRAEEDMLTEAADRIEADGKKIAELNEAVSMLLAREAETILRYDNKLDAKDRRIVELEAALMDAQSDNAALGDKN